ncbi:c-type cytochrome [Rhodospirillum centenum]|uniref:Cytochrome c n=1 Tax=Rhodospirillum centenum (strain ATCC 51521 / SW) TaxID=414684 RepID=B6IWU0_RHOCS|nr:cytochrome c family protein [Rhodospirillum centenum]ACJ00764.1 cytochrome c [Rhodospirillum centenum SW]
MAGSDLNRIMMAVLGAILLAMMCGFIADQIVKPKQLAENAYKVTLPETAAAPAESTPGATASGTGAADAAPAAAGGQEAGGPEPIAPLLAAADPQAGQKASRPCLACHTFEKGGPTRVGPNLWNIVNASHAHMEGFAYSDAMKALQGKPWDYEALNRFLADPRGTVPGTKMIFAGIKNQKDRADLIAWLRTLSDEPAPLP